MREMQAKVMWYYGKLMATTKPIAPNKEKSVALKQRH
jgi:hypothetical protein